MKFLILALLITLPFSTAQAQKRKPAPAVEPCKLTIDQVPTIRGLRLGQSHEHLKRILPTRFDRFDWDKTDEYGVLRVSLMPASLADPEKLSGINYISLIYFDDSLKSIEIRYGRDIEWQSNPHFVGAIAEQLKLPRVGWLERDPAYLICLGFVVEVAHASIMPTLRIVDLQFPDEIKQRKAEVEEKKRARFRP